MQNKVGEMVVNEFESLEANFGSSKMEEELSIGMFLQTYWYKLMVSNVECYLGNKSRYHYNNYY